MDREEFELREQKYQNRVATEINRAPKEFQGAFGLLCSGDVLGAEKSFSQCIQQGIWPGTSSCILSFICKERKEYDQAIKFAKAGKKFGIEFPGYYYYYHSMMISLNLTDQLLECLKIIDEAIDFFSREDSLADLSDYYYQKSNILAQMAAPYSHSIDTHSLARAKEQIIEAIHCVCQSLAIISEGWEKYLKEDLIPLLKIAARAEVTRKDLPFLEEMHEITTIINYFFNDYDLNERAAYECFNEAQKKKLEGSRHEADMWFKRFLQMAQERVAYDKAFKAFVAYQAGVNLLKIYNLEDNRPDNIVDVPTREAVERIRSLWKTTLHLYETLSPQEVSDFDKDYPPGLLTDAVWNIKRDLYIMSNTWIK